MDAVSDSPVVLHTNMLDSLLVTMVCVLLLAPGSWAQEAVAENELPEVRVIATTPVGSTGVPLTKFAGNVQTINPKRSEEHTSELQSR